MNQGKLLAETVSPRDETSDQIDSQERDSANHDSDYGMSAEAHHIYSIDCFKLICYIQQFWRAHGSWPSKIIMHARLLDDIRSDSSDLVNTHVNHDAEKDRFEFMGIPIETGKPYFNLKLVE